MARLIDTSLDKLSSIMSGMGDTALECFSLAVKSYLAGEDESERVRELSDRITSSYFEAEDFTFEMLLKFQPMAKDFRFIRSCTEISYAFSRFGRYAYDMTQIRALYGDISECKHDSLSDITEKANNMIQEAVSCFASLDIRKAQEIQRDEKIVDEMYRKRLVELIEHDNTKCALAEALVLRYMERIADHAVFMTDAVNYIVTGKHRPSEERIQRHTSAKED